MAKNDEDAVAEFIRSKGITRCPTACSSPTQATLPHSDRHKLRRYAEAQEIARRGRLPGRNRAAFVGKPTAPDQALTDETAGADDGPSNSAAQPPSSFTSTAP